MKHASIAALAACIAFVSSGAARADDVVRFSKAETEALIAAKKIEWTRARDDLKVTWAFKGDNDAYFTNSKSQRNIPVSGTYNVTDRGSICFKWNPDKYMDVKDGCFAFAHDGPKTMVLNASDARVLGQLAE